MHDAGPIPPAHTPTATPSLTKSTAAESPGAKGPAAESPAAKSAAAGIIARGTLAKNAIGTGPQRQAGLLVTLVLGALTAVPPLSMDMYLPALPQVTDSLHSPAATVQLTLTACLAGMALGQLVVGPLSDRWGRRRPLLAGMVIYVLATVACAFAPSVLLLICFRLLQGLAGAAGIVISRAMVRDLYDGVPMARFYSNLMLISGVAPIIAPTIGGQILRFTDWRGVFAVLTVIGILLTVVVWRRLPEPLPPEHRHSGALSDTFGAMRRLLADRVFTGYVLTGSFAFAALFTYVSASSFVVQNVYGASPQTFGLLFGLNSVGIVGFGQLNGKVLVGRVPMDRVIAVGLGFVMLSAVSLVLMTTGVFGRPGLPAIAAALFVLMSSMGLTLPTAQTQALLRTKRSAGSASALIGTSSFLIGALVSPLAGVAGDNTAVPMAVIQLTCVLVAVACFVGLCRPGRRTVEGP